ncbi:hypothetical protein BK127_40820, partial [Paenibacillus sp. FSL H7-0331]
MEKDPFAQLIIWHQEDEHEKIVDNIMKIPQSDRDYDTVSLLARAMNNLERYDEALQQLLTIANLYRMNSCFKQPTNSGNDVEKTEKEG